PAHREPGGPVKAGPSVFTRTLQERRKPRVLAPPPATAGGGWEGVATVHADPEGTPPQPSPAVAGEGTKSSRLPPLPRGQATGRRRPVATMGHDRIPAPGLAPGRPQARRRTGPGGGAQPRRRARPRYPRRAARARRPARGAGAAVAAAGAATAGGRRAAGGGARGEGERTGPVRAQHARRAARPAARAARLARRRRAAGRRHAHLRR